MQQFYKVDTIEKRKLIKEMRANQGIGLFIGSFIYKVIYVGSCLVFLIPSFSIYPEIKWCIDNNYMELAMYYSNIGRVKCKRSIA